MTGHLRRTVGGNLRRYRLDRGYDTAAFAERIGMPGTDISVIERGDGDLSLESVERIADVLGIDPLSLFDSGDTDRF